MPEGAKGKKSGPRAPRRLLWRLRGACRGLSAGSGPARDNESIAGDEPAAAQGGLPEGLLAAWSRPMSGYRIKTTGGSLGALLRGLNSDFSGYSERRFGSRSPTTSLGLHSVCPQGAQLITLDRSLAPRLCRGTSS